MTIPILVMPLIAGALVTRKIPARPVRTFSLILMAAGALFAAAGALVLAWPFASAMMLFGIGFGLHAGMVDNEELATAPDEEAGMAAGTINLRTLFSRKGSGVLNAVVAGIGCPH